MIVHKRTTITAVVIVVLVCQDVLASGAVPRKPTDITLLEGSLIALNSLLVIFLGSLVTRINAHERAVKKELDLLKNCYTSEMQCTLRRDRTEEILNYLSESIKESKIHADNTCAALHSIDVMLAKLAIMIENNEKQNKKNDRARTDDD